MYYDGAVHIEPDDQCFTCDYFARGVSCPLLEALGLGVVSLDSEITVQNCGFYKEFKRTLKLVDLPAAGESDELPPPIDIRSPKTP